MSNNGTDRQPASSVGPMRCSRCDCTFKRSEHLKRHERVHDTHKRFACSQCSKLFTRSDILRRHEATHIAIEQAVGVRPTRTRACTECARSRERCTKNDPCQRCSTKGLHCEYPQPRSNSRNQPPQVGPSQHYPQADSTSNHGNSQRSSQLRTESMVTMSVPALGSSANPEPQDAQNTYGSYNTSQEHMLNFSIPEPMIPDYHGNQILQSTMDFPMNWLPPDNTMAIDYDSIIGLGASSLDFFSLPSSSSADLSLTATTHHRHDESASSATSAQASAIARSSLQPLGTGGQSPVWTTASSSGIDRNMSSESPHSMSHAISPSAAPGGLYATSINGARMPCTIRARRTSRLIPGGTRIKPVTDSTCNVHFDTSHTLDFPDMGHIFVDGFTSRSNAGSHRAAAINHVTYGQIHQRFQDLCLNESCGYLTFASTRFPSLPALNMFISLYFENFDDIIPILHESVVSINDHWIVALAASTIGCQYAEADEFSRSVEPMHEFLRRAIEVEASSHQPQSVDAGIVDIALAQARTLSQIGMLYCGSPRLFRHAKAQHSSLVELARSMSFPLLMPSTTPAESVVGRENTPGDAVWRVQMREECKRRIGYAIWTLDCMTAYHFSQQPSMPPDLVPVPLPNDRLWYTRSAQDWASKSASIQEIPPLTSATVTLFREKEVVPDLGEFSRIVLLHSVFREVFYIRDCFEGPLGNWMPSIEQIENIQAGSRPHESSAPGDRSMLDSRRNSALDCIDVLHWAANGTIAKAAGAEHPTVLHLHLSRTVILSPLSQIRSFADSIVLLARNPPSRTLNATRRKQIIEAERDIIEWAQRDQCKARLAVLHGGCMFWHIRRYSCRAFYEPMSVFLATLTIWAYSSYASRTVQPYQRPQPLQEYNSHGGPSKEYVTDNVGPSHSPDSATSPGSEDGEPLPTFIHLDRPNDDEMVQAFVRYGTSTRMRANITGVGDVYSTKGPARILREGRKILGAVSTAWGRTGNYANVLETLEQVASGRLTLNTA